MIIVSFQKVTVILAIKKTIEADVTINKNIIKVEFTTEQNLKGFL